MRCMIGNAERGVRKMRKSTSVATVILAAGAGWLAAKMWQDNTYGIRDRMREGGSRVRLEGERMRARGRRMGEEMRHRGEEAWERGRHRAEEAWNESGRPGRGMLHRGREMLRRMRGGNKESTGYSDEEEYGTYSGPYTDEYPEYGRGGYPSRSSESYRSQGYRNY